MRLTVVLLALAGFACASTPQPAPPPPPPPEPAPPIVIVPAPGKKRIPREAPPPPRDELPPGDDVARPTPPTVKEPADAPRDERRRRDVAVVEGPPPKELDPQRTMTVHALDIGQGAATLVETPCGAILVDTGGETNESFDGPTALVAQLEAFFARRADLKRTIALLVITHPHIDHVRGVPKLLQAFTVERVVDNGRPGDDVVAAEMQALRAHTAKLGRRYRPVVDVGAKAVTDDVVDPLKCRAVDPKVRVLAGGRTRDPGWGEDRFQHRYFDNENNHSVVLRVDFGESSLLITGDLEETALKDLVAQHGKSGLLDVDAYHVGHHGSANGTTQELLDAMTPDVALISMGDAARRLDWTAWQYGHPRQRVVDLLEGEVRLRRPAVDVQVGTGQRRFEKVRVERAVYGTGWEGPIVVDMTADGRVYVRPTQRYVDDGPG